MEAPRPPLRSQPSAKPRRKSLRERRSDFWLTVTGLAGAMLLSLGVIGAVVEW